MTATPLVTIAVPTFNRATMLERCLESARDQSYTEIEIVVYDNASTDDTEAVVERTVGGAPACALRAPRTNLGALRNFQRRARQADGDYFMWLADDDWLDSDYVERCVEALRATHTPCSPTAMPFTTATDRPAETEPGVSMTQSSHKPSRVRLLHMGQPVTLLSMGCRPQPRGAKRHSTTNSGATGSMWRSSRRQGRFGACLARSIARLSATRRRFDRQPRTLCASVASSSPPTYEQALPTRISVGRIERLWRSRVRRSSTGARECSTGSPAERRATSSHGSALLATSRCGALVILAAEATFRAPTKPNLSGQRDERCEHGPSERTNLRDRAPARMVTPRAWRACGNTAISSTS